MIVCVGLYRLFPSLQTMVSPGWSEIVKCQVFTRNLRVQQRYEQGPDLQKIGPKKLISNVFLWTDPTITENNVLYYHHYIIRARVLEYLVQYLPNLRVNNLA